MKTMSRVFTVLAIWVLLAGMVMAAQPVVPGQVIANEDNESIIAVSTGNKILIHSVAIIATSTTSVEVYLYNGDHNLFGSEDDPLIVDLDGIDGPAGVILPHNPVGWFCTDTISEAVKLSMSGTPANTPVIVIVTYSTGPDFNDDDTW